jgi:glycosyltransferase involved in cell wall biosynthesis
MWGLPPTTVKLLFVHERFGAWGGAEANLLAVAAELKARGHRPAILHGAAPAKNETAWREAFGRRVPLARQGNASRTREALAACQPDAIYVHKMAELDVLETLLQGGAPVVRMVHDHDLYCMRSCKYNFFTRQICHRAASPFCVFPCGASLARNQEAGLPVKWVSYFDKRREIELNKEMDRLVVATDYMKRELVRNGFDPDKIEIHAPVPSAGEASWRSNFSDRNLVIYAGQIVRGKGVDVLLESLARIRLPFECLILGDGNHRASCEKLSRKLGLSGRVQFKGYVAPDELKGFYRDASVAVLSSVWPEPFGAVGLEAMRYGLPVVAFDAGGIKEWLTDGQNGRLVPWMDRGAFAASIEALLLDKALARKLGERGRQMVAEQYPFSKYIDGLEELFARVAGRTSCQPGFA